MANPWDPIPDDKEGSLSSESSVKPRHEWSELRGNILPSGLE